MNRTLDSADSYLFFSARNYAFNEDNRTDFSHSQVPRNHTSTVKFHMPFTLSPRKKYTKFKDHLFSTFTRSFS